MSTDQPRPGTPEPTAPDEMDTTRPIVTDATVPLATDANLPLATDPDQTEQIDAVAAKEGARPPAAVQDTVAQPAPTTSTPATATAAASTATPSTATPNTARPTLRVGTVVWGLVLAVIGAGVIAIAAGAQFDLELTFIGLLVLAGVALLAGSITTSIRRRSR